MSAHAGFVFAADHGKTSAQDVEAGSFGRVESVVGEVGFVHYPREIHPSMQPRLQQTLRRRG